MVEFRKSIRFLSKADLDTLGLGMGDTIDILEKAFRAKAAGKVMMPPKTFFHRLGPRFYRSMVSASPDLGYAGCKWQSGDPDNPSIGLPYIQGLYILTEDATGQMRAIMDAEWISGRDPEPGGTGRCGDDLACKGLIACRRRTIRPNWLPGEAELWTAETSRKDLNETQEMHRELSHLIGKPTDTTDRQSRRRIRKRGVGRGLWNGRPLAQGHLRSTRDPRLRPDDRRLRHQSPGPGPPRPPGRRLRHRNQPQDAH